MTIRQEKVWIFTFEYAGVAKIGGLGEVPPNQVQSLKEDFAFTIFIPSHGQKERLEKQYGLRRLPFNCIGQIDLSLIGMNEIEQSYRIGFYEVFINDIRIILLCGENAFTSTYLDDPAVYDPDTFKGKLCLYSLGIRCFIDYIIDNREELPALIHLHDYHVVIPFMGIKQQLYKHGLDLPSLITIHLMTYPKEKIGFYRACGIDSTPLNVLTKEGRRPLTLEQILDICSEKDPNTGEIFPPTIEKIGAFISDLVTTVSESYLKTDVIPKLGGELIRFKTDFIWDGCDWDYEKIYNTTLNDVQKELREVQGKSDNEEISRKDLKNYLLTYKIGNLDRSPIIKSNKIIKVINEVGKDNPFVQNGRIKPFDESGPLMITTGRISTQKGFDIILDALPKVLESVPNAKFLFLILPTEYSLAQIHEYAEIVKKYPENLRIIFGVATDIFHLAHISADIYAAISRWEPFGIIALEAMSVRLPIIATRVGGLQETVIDVRNTPEFGTGILIKKNSVEELTESLITFFLLAQIEEETRKSGSIYSDPKILQTINRIPDQVLKSRVLLDGEYYEKIRENAYNRVKYNFRWAIVSQKVKHLYAKVKEQNQFS